MVEPHPGGPESISGFGHRAQTQQLVTHGEDATPIDASGVCEHGRVTGLIAEVDRGPGAQQSDVEVLGTGDVGHGQPDVMDGAGPGQWL